MTEKDLAIPDFHCHILPGMDDGSESPEMTLAMLNEMSRQKIPAVVATPHFYPHRDRLEDFEERRQKALQKLRNIYIPGSHPDIYLAAEVAYYHGISHSNELYRLCIQGTRYLLLEMPFCRWPDDMVAEVLAIREEQDIQVILAHVERYLSYQKRKVLSLLEEKGIWMQSNAEFFLNPKTHKKALKMLKAGKLRFLGSDSHNILNRPPNLGKAVAKLLACGYCQELVQISVQEEEILREASPWIFSLR